LAQGLAPSSASPCPLARSPGRPRLSCFGGCRVPAGTDSTHHCGITPCLTVVDRGPGPTIVGPAPSSPPGGFSSSRGVFGFGGARSGWRYPPSPFRASSPPPPVGICELQNGTAFRFAALKRNKERPKTERRSIFGRSLFFVMAVRVLPSSRLGPAHSRSGRPAGRPVGQCSFSRAVLSHSRLRAGVG